MSDATLPGQPFTFEILAVGVSMGGRGITIERLSTGNYRIHTGNDAYVFTPEAARVLGMALITGLTLEQRIDAAGGTGGAVGVGVEDLPYDSDPGQ